MPAAGGGADHAAVARMVARFSPVALTGAALAVGAGLLLAVAYVGDFAALGGTTYGRTLLVKVGCLGFTAALGAWNWRRVRPRLGTPAATATLRRSAALELILGFCLLAATAVLVALPAPKL
jgi:copper transport protein